AAKLPDNDASEYPDGQLPNNVASSIVRVVSLSALAVSPGPVADGAGFWVLYSNVFVEPNLPEEQYTATDPEISIIFTPPSSSLAEATSTMSLSGAGLLTGELLLFRTMVLSYPITLIVVIGAVPSAFGTVIFSLHAVSNSARAITKDTITVVRNLS
ncbi:MAG: hypothetical protein OEZ02_13275, partial [Anaerolineae bacterium]|nr:hypothetical protein [Anaerolineae bacterium]